MGYEHLSIDEREVILKMQARKASMREIGNYLGRSGGMVSRELNRNVSSTGDYKPHLAQRYYHKRRATSKEPYRLEYDVSLRQFFPKGMDFSRVNQSELDKAVELLNNRPRKCLNYRTPTEVFRSKPMRCASD